MDVTGSVKTKSILKRLPWVFGLAWLLAIAIFSYHLHENWSYPWFGNPDQDLVFLRDGLRLSQLKRPLYSDHPGLIQMILGAIAHLLNMNGGAALRDQDWQDIFRLHKTINAITMATLLACCSEALSRLINKAKSAAIGACCALSTGTTTLVYQLRNEFFSAYLFYLGSLIICLTIQKQRNRIKHSEPPTPIPYWVPTACSTLYFFSLLAKIQAIPLMGLFCLGLVAWSAGSSSFQKKAWIENLKLSILFLFTWTIPLLLSGIEAASLPKAWAVLALALFPIQLACTGFEPNPRIRKINSFRSLIGFAFGALLYTSIAHQFHWGPTSWNPMAMNQYTHAPKDTTASYLTWLFRGAVDGYLLLFERTFDGQSVAKALSIMTPVMLTASIAIRVRNQTSEQKSWRKSYRTDAIAGYAFLCAGLMALVASLRWPVDHYLSYQQPLLYLSIGLMIKPKGHGLFRALAIYAILSATLISIKYPSQAHATYVKIPTPMIQSEIPGSAKLPSYNPGLCAPQHAGLEWRGSIVGEACRY